LDAEVLETLVRLSGRQQHLGDKFQPFLHNLSQQHLDEEFRIIEVSDCLVKGVHNQKGVVLKRLARAKVPKSYLLTYLVS